MSGTFPDGFLWGAATAAHQVEGGNVGNDHWELEHAGHSPFADRAVRRATRSTAGLTTSTWWPRA
jgi:beta-glucosidase/6-phospho-beta-glucosidase/beta-galactosidase